MRRRVHVVGAGTSGLIAARELAASGIEVHVYDQKKRIGYPPMASGIVSIKGMDGLRVNYRKAITNTLYGADVHIGKSVMHIMARAPQAYVLDREQLNLACYDQAVDAGAEVLTGTRVYGKELDEMHENGIIVGADGAVSGVAKHFGMGSVSRQTLTYKMEFEVEAAERKKVDLFFESAVAPKFFAWLCPNSRDVIEAGIGIDSRYGNSKAAFGKFLKIKEVAEALDRGKRREGYASIIPMQKAGRIVDAQKEVLLVGDAAGQVKPTTGGGIVFGGGAALLAAKAIEKHISSGTSLDEYERLFERSFGTDMRLHRLITKLYSSLDSRKLEIVMRTMKMLGTEGFLSAYGDMDRPSLILKRLFLRNAAE